MRNSREPLPNEKGEIDAITAKIRAELARAGLLPPEQSAATRKDTGPNHDLGIDCPSGGKVSMVRFLAGYLLPLLLAGVAALLLSALFPPN